MAPRATDGELVQVPVAPPASTSASKIHASGLKVGDVVYFRWPGEESVPMSSGEAFVVQSLALHDDTIYVRRQSDMLGVNPYKVCPTRVALRSRGYSYGVPSLYDPSVDMAPRLDRVFSVKRAEDEASIDDLGREYEVVVVFPNGSFIGKHICLTGQAVWTKLLSPGQVNWKK